MAYGGSNQKIDAAADFGRNPVVSQHQIQLKYGDDQAERDGTAEPVSRDQIIRRERGYYFPCSADHEQDWQPYPVDPYSCYTCDHTYTHTYYILCHTTCVSRGWQPIR